MCSIGCATKKAAAVEIRGAKPGPRSALHTCILNQSRGSHEASLSGTLIVEPAQHRPTRAVPGHETQLYTMRN
jgi:hypothetical protein